MMKVTYIIATHAWFSVYDNVIIAAEYPAHDASDTGNLSLLTTLIQNGKCSINERDKFGSTLVHKGMTKNHLP